MLKPETNQWTPGPCFNFLNLPKEIRLTIYGMTLALQTPMTFYLFQDSGSRIESFRSAQRKIPLDILHVNRKTHGEAASVLYSVSRFNVVDTMERQFKLLNAFLTSIGPANAASIRCLCIGFPGGGGGTSLQEIAGPQQNDLGSLELLKERCSTLTTLEMFVYSNNSHILINGKGYEPQHTKEVLDQINALLNSIPSLKTVIVRIFSSFPEPVVVELMTGFGWVVLKGDGEQV